MTGRPGLGPTDADGRAGTVRCGVGVGVGHGWYPICTQRAVISTQGSIKATPYHHASNMAGVSSGHQCLVDGVKLDGDYRACVDGVVWGKCATDCSGVCEREGNCPCLCHQFDQDKVQQVDASCGLVCPLCQVAVVELRLLIKPPVPGPVRELCSWTSPPSVGGWMLEPCGDMLITADQWRLRVVRLDECGSGDPAAYRASFHRI